MKIFFISCLYLILQLLVFNVGHFEKALVENVIYIYREEDIFVNLLIIYICLFVNQLFLVSTYFGVL